MQAIAKENVPWICNLDCIYAISVLNTWECCLSATTAENKGNSYELSQNLIKYNVRYATRNSYLFCRLHSQENVQKKKLFPGKLFWLNINVIRLHYANDASY